MRRTFLDRVFDACGALAAIALMMIAIVILLQTGARWLRISAQGLSEWAGYMMAAASFLAFAHTFRHGGHIRVMLVLQRLTGPARRAAEIFAHAVGTLLAGFLAFYSVKLVRVSYVLEEMSEGSDAMALWIPRSAMALGAVMLFLALAQGLYECLRGTAVFDAGDGEAARTE